MVEMNKYDKVVGTQRVSPWKGHANENLGNLQEPYGDK